MRAGEDTAMRGRVGGCDLLMRTRANLCAPAGRPPTAAWNFGYWLRRRLGNTDWAELGAHPQFQGFRRELRPTAATSLSALGPQFAFHRARRLVQLPNRPSSRPRRCRDDARAGPLRTRSGCRPSAIDQSAQTARFQTTAPPRRIRILCRWESDSPFAVRAVAPAVLPLAAPRGRFPE